jgi:hypothetical protein
MDSDNNQPSGQAKPILTIVPSPESITPAQAETQSISTSQAQISGTIGQHKPILVPGIKEGTNWNQFAFGLLVPTAAIIILMLISGATNEDWNGKWDDAHKEGIISLSSNNGTFSHTFDEDVLPIDGRYSLTSFDSLGNYDNYWYSYSLRNNNTDVIAYGDDDSEEKVGEYNSMNNTIWLTTESQNYSEMRFTFEVVDLELNEDRVNSKGPNEIFGALVCFTPLLAGMGAFISFSNDKKSLGRGLFTSVILSPLSYISGLFLMYTIK